MLPAVLTLLDWSASDVEVVEYEPIVHYHKLKGPSRKRLHLIGPTQRAHKLTGPSKRIKRLSGSE